MLSSTEKIVISDNQYIEITKEIPSKYFEWEVTANVNDDQSFKMLDNDSEIVISMHTTKYIFGKRKTYNTYDLENNMSDEELLKLVRQFSIIITDMEDNVVGAMLRHKYKEEVEE